MSFDAPVVLALAPLLGGAVWFGAAWARRARVRRAALWSQETVRAASGPSACGQNRTVTVLTPVCKVSITLPFAGLKNTSNETTSPLPICTNLP